MDIFWVAVNLTWRFLGTNVEALLASCALILTVNRLSVMRKHNKLSVKPYLTDHVHKNNLSGRFEISYELINNGLGPAFIEGFVVKYENVSIEYTDDDALKAKLRELLGLGNFETVRVLERGYALAAKESVVLLKISVSNKDERKAQVIKDGIKTVSLEIQYKSFYEESFKFSTN